MGDVAIRTEGLGKQYSIGGPRVGYQTFRDLLMRGVTAPWRTLRRGNRINANQKIWALRDVSFEVKRGEVIGIVGRNGAGKSTLLKILSRVTEPTTGEADMHGRVSSLLEVGTGFNPELTGRENVYLNGAILGMKRAEIGRRFDEIVEFAGVGKFLDTPAKHYSSGMYVRLAFAVAAHLEPDILIVDEVLAVGDIGFQRKCMGRMKQATHQGRTVLLVSHNMGAISSLCSRVLVMEDGQLAFDGPARDGIDLYTRKVVLNEEGAGPICINRENYRSDKHYRLTGLEILDENGVKRDAVSTGDFVCFRIHFELKEALPNPGFRVRIFSEDRQELLRLATDPISGYHIPAMEAGNGSIDCCIPRFPFTAGIYHVDVSVVRPMQELLHEVEAAVVLDVQPADVYGSGTLLTTKAGFFVSDHKWRIVSPV